MFILNENANIHIIIEMYSVRNAIEYNCLIYRLYFLVDKKMWNDCSLGVDLFFDNFMYFCKFTNH